MRVLCVIDSLGSGGAQRQFVNIVNGLARQHDVEVLLYNPGSDFYKGDLNTGIPIHRVERPSGARGFRIDVVWRLIRHTRQSDAIISFLPTANIYCAVAAAFSQVKQVSCEMSVVNETEGRLRRRLADLANRHSDHVVCNSFTQADYIARQPGMDGKVSTVWNGCAELAYAERDLSARSIYDFLVVARVAFPKNGVRLVEALKIFHRRNGYVPRVAWAGRDDLDDRARQMKLQMLDFLAAHPEVHDNFTWLGEVSNVESLYDKAGALLSVSTYEGVPVVICEAMFSGCPVVASQISDNAIILGDGARGLLCDPLSPEDICLAMERRLNASPDELRSMTKGARAYAMENFSISKMVDGYDRVLAKLTKTA